jgi:hypothetical protein
MKKILLTLILAFVLASCSKSEESIGPETNPLVGRWKLTEKKQGNTVIPVSACETSYAWYQFNADFAAQKGTANIYSSGGSNFCNQSTWNTSYLIQANDLTIYTNLYVEKYHIVETNSLYLKIKKYYTKQVQNNIENNIPENLQVTETCVLVQ